MAGTIKRCVVASCVNNSKDHPNKIFLTIPKDKNRRKNWAVALNVKRIFKDRICEDHFDLEKDSTNWMFYKMMGKKVMLNPSVVPHKNLDVVSISKSSQLTESEKKRKLEATLEIEKVERDVFRIQSPKKIAKQMLFEKEEISPSKSSDFCSVFPSGLVKIEHFTLEKDLENVQYKMVDSPQILTKDVVSLKSPEVKMEIEEPLICTTEAIKEEVESQEIDELNKVLEDGTKPSEENEFNINRSQLEADKLEQEPIEKYQMLTTELKCIKEKCQILESENTGLSRKVEMYEKKLKHSKAYHKEILNRDANLRIAMADIQEMVEKLREEQIRALELSEKTKLAEEALEKLEKLSQNSQKIKEEKADYEESFVKKIEAKCDKFEELMEMNKDIHEPNLLHRIIFAQWQKSRAHYEEVMRQKNDIIAKLSELLNYEKLSDRKLNDIYEETNKSHEQIQQLGQSSEYEIVRIKTEINDLEEST